MKKQTNYLLLSILLFAALLCGLHSCTPCKDEGMEYEKFSVADWKIVAYTKNGKDLLDSLIVKDTLQYVSLPTRNRSEDRECYEIVPSTFKVEGYSTDSIANKELEGGWLWNINQNQITFDIRTKTIYSKNAVRKNTYFQGPDHENEPKYVSPPFGLAINWTTIFNGDSLKLDGQLKTDTYQLIFVKNN